MTRYAGIVMKRILVSCEIRKLEPSRQNKIHVLCQRRRRDKSKRSTSICTYLSRYYCCPFRINFATGRGYAGVRDKVKSFVKLLKGKLNDVVNNCRITGKVASLKISDMCRFPPIHAAQTGVLAEICAARFRWAWWLISFAFYPPPGFLSRFLILKNIQQGEWSHAMDRAISK